tara:strand:- start:39 stop:500 length:462 start_codon:yes stop_codon:yes gene_type:complete
MLDKSNDNLNNIELMARAKAITDQVLANVVKEQRRDRQIFNYKLDQTKRELYEKYEEVESRQASMAKELQKLSNNKGKLTARQLCIITGQPTDLNTTKPLGGKLSDISRELGYIIDKTLEGNYNVGLYSPYVCKEYLERYNLAIPPQLQYIKR